MTIENWRDQPHDIPDQMPERHMGQVQHDADKSDVIRLFGLRLSDVSLREAAETTINRARSGSKLQIFFVNAHCINIAAHNKQYNHILKNNELLYADGVGMAIAARICGQHLTNNVNGTDLFPLLCEHAARHKVPIALLGSKPGIADACAAQMKAAYPGLQITFAHHGYSSRDDDPDIIRSINNCGAGILLVAKGVPAQEMWIAENREAINTPVILGVGALFDFYSGTVKRAPPLVRQLRLEWLFRLLIEPRRMFTRYVIGNPVFILRAIFWRLTRR